MDVRLTRRNALLATAAFLLPRAARAQDMPTLAAAARKSGRIFGASIGEAALEVATYGDLYRREVALVTTDTALKFDVLRPTQADFAFAPADRIAEFAKTHDLLLRGHTLIWNENTPAWLRQLSSREIERVFDEHIETVVTRYAGRMQSWDVVNEPFWPGHGKPGGYRDGPWFAAMGPSYIKRAFDRARRFDPQAILCINEAHCEIENDWGAAIRPRLLQLVDDLLDKGAPVQAVGLQGHLQPQWPSDDDAFRLYLQRFGERGLDIYISELDVNDVGFAQAPPRRDAQVADRYERFLRHVLDEPRVKAVILWQLADRYSWYQTVGGAYSRGRDARPLPYDALLRPTPAREAIMRALKHAAGHDS